MSDTHRFFKPASVQACEDMRARLNAVFGYPSQDAASLFPPASECVKSKLGKPLVSIDSPLLELPAVETELTAILLGGSVVELTRQQYESELPALP